MLPQHRDGHTITPPAGISLQPIISGGSKFAPRQLFVEHQETRSIRDGKWKAVWSKRMPNEIKWELYDLESDRCETKDLATDYPDIVALLNADWLSWAAHVKAYPFFENAARIIQIRTSELNQKIPQ